jgi:SAM-dependent methyltransferase
MLAQLGCRVISLDVSATALRITEERFRRFPPVGCTSAPTLVHFDGRRVELDDESVDRIACNDAFHHVPNPEEVLAEFTRILVPGGVCVMVEPGPRHSRSSQAQFEMRNFCVVERDIIVEEIGAQAVAAGFETVGMGVYCGLPRFVGVDAFDSAIAATSAVPNEVIRGFLENRRLIQLRKRGTATLDSRSRGGLAAELEVSLVDRTIHARVRNSGVATWLETSMAVGTVNLGAHLYRRDRRLVAFDFMRVALQATETPIPPGGVVEVTASLPDLAPGDYLIEFDLVAESVGWFAELGSQTVTLEL